jgi:photosystem II stability/assembly factor-like uncharacterized protein
MKKFKKERFDIGRRRALCFVATVPLVSMEAVWANPVLDALRRPAFVAPHVRGGVLLDVAKSGKRIVAVGERGVVLFSDDIGATWQQASVPVSVTLTAVNFVDEKYGWVTGHSGVVLATSDGGGTWRLQLEGKRAADLWRAEVSAGSKNDDDSDKRLQEAQRLVSDGPDKPFLDMHFFDRKRGFVIGAYGLIFATADGGETWSPWMDRLDNPKALHFNALAVQGQRILIVGEQGLLLQSVDGGKTFVRLSSPYPGSWFAVAALPDGKWLLAGLKGNIYTYSPAGFSQCEVPIPVTIGCLSLMHDGSVLALNQAGQALISRDSGGRWTSVSWPPGPPLTAVVELDGSRLLASSLRGVRELPFPK